MIDRKVTFREFIVDNMMDGDDGGTLTMKASALADEIQELFNEYMEDN